MGTLKKYLNYPTLFIICLKVFLLGANAQAITDDNEVGIIIGEDTVRVLTTDEMSAILAHELTHISEQHLTKFNIALRLINDVNAELVVNAGLFALGLSVKSMFSFSEQLPYVFLFCVASGGLGLLTSYYIQQQELKADQGVKQLGQNPEALISALEKMEKIKGKSSIQKEGEYSISAALLASKIFLPHPSIEARKKALGLSEQPSDQNIHESLSAKSV